MFVPSCFCKLPFPVTELLSPGGNGPVADKGDDPGALNSQLNIIIYTFIAVA
jgi:hypothetical protein